MAYSSPLARKIKCAFTAGVFVGLLLFCTLQGVVEKAGNAFSYPVPVASLSKPNPQKKNDVFINFKGDDIRRGFLSHLIESLQRRKINFFVDEHIEKGDEISQALLGAIERSLISIAIFSQNYAASRWCLDELVKMLECREKRGQIVLPVFFNVDPSDVRHQKGTYKNAFANHTERYGLTVVETWKSALNQSANLSGFHSSRFRNDSELVEEIVMYVVKKRSTHLLDDYPVVRYLRVGTFHPFYSNRSADAYGRLVSEVLDGEISPMIRIVQTTIEGFVGFYSDFDGCRFLANVSGESRRHGIETLHPVYSNRHAVACRGLMSGVSDGEISGMIGI